jgi:hypothetical protein
MVRSASIMFLVSVLFCANGQDPAYMELVQKEAELNSLFERLYSDTLSSPDPLLKQIETIMAEALVLDGAMVFPWSRLDRIGVITSDDGRLRIFTWHVVVDPDRYSYFGYIQMENRRDRIRVFQLKDNMKPQRNLQNLEQTAEDWFGKLYYQIVTEKHKRRIYYTLLGMDFNNTSSTIKTIETISLQRNKPKFEKGLFLYGNTYFDRIVLEYSAQVSMSVRYDESIGMITFDHLEPLHPIYRNNYEFYGPDGSFDGFEFNEGVWIYHKDIDARNLD